MAGVSKELIEQARNADLFAYLQSYEPTVLKRDGPNYRHKEHDSLVYVTGKRYWYWNSRGRKPFRKPEASSRSYREPERKPLALPWAKRCAAFMASYLQRRGISSEVISRSFRLGLLYEANYKGEAVCVFVGKDDAGKSRFACMRSIGGNLKKDVVGSDKRFSFCYPPQNPGSRQLAVLEAPIDALSHATLQELEGWKWDGYRLSLGGTSPVALVSFLERHPEIYRVTLYMDNDLAGLVNARKIKALLENDNRFKHIRVGVNPPRTGKDYNEKLQRTRQQMQDRQQPCRPKEAAVSI